MLPFHLVSPPSPAGDLVEGRGAREAERREASDVYSHLASDENASADACMDTTSRDVGVTLPDPTEVPTDTPPQSSAKHEAGNMQWDLRGRTCAPSLGSRPLARALCSAACAPVLTCAPLLGSAHLLSSSVWLGWSVRLVVWLVGW